jgi:hypothetical protein
LSVPDLHAGKRGRCPKCKNLILVPQIQDTSPLTNPSKAADQEAAPKGSPHGQALLDVPQKDKTQAQPTTQYEVSDRPLEDRETLEGTAKIDQAEPVPKRKLPWIIDIFLYLLNLAGIIHLIGLWLSVFLLCPLVMEFWGLGIEYIPIVYTLPVAYVLYYFAECIRDSAAGGCRVPDFWMHPAKSDKWDCISQLLVVLGCIAVCFWLVSVYYAVKERTDLIYWLLLACGGFFFPMVLLAVVLFDSYNAFNPILIIGSIFRTFLPYCCMVLLFYGGTLLFMKIDYHLCRLRLLPALPFIFRVVQFYLMFVAVGLLGRFYWHYQDKLRWDV